MHQVRDAAAAAEAVAAEVELAAVAPVDTSTTSLEEGSSAV